jgi:hypothetical protein
MEKAHEGLRNLKKGKTMGKIVLTFEFSNRGKQLPSCFSELIRSKILTYLKLSLELERLNNLSHL